MKGQAFISEIEELKSELAAVRELLRASLDLKRDKDRTNAFTTTTSSYSPSNAPFSAARLITRSA